MTATISKEDLKHEIEEVDENYLELVLRLLKQFPHRQKTNAEPIKLNETTQQTEGARILQALEECGLLGCIEGGDGKLSENYKQYLWNDK
jgi:hypothetical protein